MKQKKTKTIGEMTNSRRMWGFNASTRVVKNKKGKGSYSRKGKNSYQGDGAFFYAIISSDSIPSNLKKRNIE